VFQALLRFEVVWATSFAVFGTTPVTERIVVTLVICWHHTSYWRECYFSHLLSPHQLLTIVLLL